MRSKNIVIIFHVALKKKLPASEKRQNIRHIRHVHVNFNFHRYQTGNISQAAFIITHNTNTHVHNKSCHFRILRTNPPHTGQRYFYAVTLHKLHTRTTLFFGSTLETCITINTFHNI